MKYITNSITGSKLADQGVKMTLKFEVTSKETIKPSSPTPQHLRNCRLSLLDQHSSPFPMSLILFYSANHNDGNTQVERLKKSLAETLTQFYPLAGRIDGNEFVTCSDEGINLFEARVFTQLLEVLRHPDDLEQLLPRDNVFGFGPGVFLSIQLNIFACGGIALGVYLSHKVGDVSSLSLFLNHWAAVARGENNITGPIFDGASLFPPRELLPFLPPKLESETKQESETKKVVCKRIAFNAANIATLKARCSNSSGVQQPTRVEAVSALILMCAMNARRKKLDSTVQLAVNLRGRMVPPLSNLYMGNLSISTTHATGKEGHPDLQSLVTLLHEAKTSVDDAYVRKLRYEDGIDKAFNSAVESVMRAAGGVASRYVVSSWCTFPFYDVDFGFGKPMWATTVNPHYERNITLMDTEYENGVEAIVSLTEEEMVGFQCDPHLTAYTSRN